MVENLFDVRLQIKRISWDVNIYRHTCNHVDKATRLCGSTSNKLTGTSFFMRYLCTWDTASCEYSYKNIRIHRCVCVSKSQRENSPPAISLEETRERFLDSMPCYTHVRMRQQLFHNIIVVDLSGKFSPVFRTFELLVRFDLQCTNKQSHYAVVSAIHGYYMRRYWNLIK